MTTHRDRFSVDVRKRASRVRSHSLAHVLKELLANSLDAGATQIYLTCTPIEDTRVDRSGCRAYRVGCIDNGFGCDDPEVLRRVGSTTSDETPRKRGRFGQGLIDVITISEKAEIRTLRHRLVFEQGCQISTTRSSIRGMEFNAVIRHPDDDLTAVDLYFDSVILPSDVHFKYNGSLVGHRIPVRSIPNVELPTPLYDPKTERVKNKVVATSVQILERFGEKPMIYEMGIPVEEMPWDLPYDVDVGQKTPLDVDRAMLPANYKEHLVTALVGPLSDLYATYCTLYDTVPREILESAENARQLTPEVQEGVVRAATGHSKSVIDRRNPLDKDDRSEAQELENLGRHPVFLRSLPFGVRALLAENPMVADTHDELCKTHYRSGELPPETPRQRACMDAFGEIASALLGRRVYCDRAKGGPAATWSKGRITLNVLYSPLWENPLGEEALGIILHECAHGKISGHNLEFMNEVARLGAKFGLWVGHNPELWRQIGSKL